MPPSKNARKNSKNNANHERKRYLRRLGLLIHRELTARDLSMESLASKTGAARSTLFEIIAGRSNPRLLTVRAIALSLGYRGVSEFLRQLE